MLPDVLDNLHQTLFAVLESPDEFLLLAQIVLEHQVVLRFLDLGCQLFFEFVHSERVDSHRLHFVEGVHQLALVQPLQL